MFLPTFTFFLVLNQLLASSVDDKIQDIWGSDAETTTVGSCTCEDYKSCMNKDGAGIINIRIDDCRSYKKCCDEETSAPLGIPDSTPSSSCVCVEQHLCDNAKVDGAGLIDIRIRDCSSYLEVCCDPDNILPTPPPLPPLRLGCGYRNSNGIGFKIKDPMDREAEYGEFPWMIAVFTRTESKGLPIYQCGGALIHFSVVITAAHCVYDKNNVKIRAGEWDTQTKKEQFPFQDRDVSSVVTHPEFNSEVLFNDVALLFLERAVDFAPHINVVCLPPPEAVFNTGRCFSSGWGKNNFAKEDRYQVILKKIDLPVVPRDVCQANLRKTRLGRFFKLHESFVCAGGEEGKDTCTGDGGSPLVCPVAGQDERYYHVGIVAWGIGCGEANVPGVYANVAKFRTWIDEEMKKRNLEISGYEVEESYEVKSM